MLIELFIFFQVVVLGLFLASFFTKQEILWALTAVVAAFLMFSSWNIEYYVYAYNTTSFAYDAIATVHNYPYLMGINMIFLALAVLLGIFDLFDKYGGGFAKKNPSK